MTSSGEAVDSYMDDEEHHMQVSAANASYGGFSQHAFMKNGNIDLMHMSKNNLTERARRTMKSRLNDD